MNAANEKQEQEQAKPAEQWPEKCPDCGGPLELGYGAMGGGMGPYVFCLADNCQWWLKRQEVAQ